MAIYFDRYERFKLNGEVSTLPFIKLTRKLTDKKIVYRLGKSRLDKLSQDYYNNPYHGWLIMLANPEYGGLEFNIPDRTAIRIPYPFRQSLEQYQNAEQIHIKLYGK